MGTYGYARSSVYRYARTAAKGPDFYTPATFKAAAGSFVTVLHRDTGIPWKLHGIQKSNRKTGAGQEACFEAKVYPAGPEHQMKPLSAALSASMTVWGPNVDYLVQAVVEQGLRPAFEEKLSTKDFAAMNHWISNLKIHGVTIA
jgi:hypothetical protein